MVAKKESLRTVPSYLRCMKNSKTKLAFAAAMTRASHTFKAPRLIVDAPTVNAVRTKRAVSTMKRNR